MQLNSFTRRSNATLVGLAATTLTAGIANAGFVYDPARSTTVITYQAFGAPASATFAAGAGAGWYSPNFTFLNAVWEPAVGTHPWPPVTPNWNAYGTAVTHRFLANLTPAGIVNAIPTLNFTQASHNITLDAGNLIGPGTLRVDYTFEVAATIGGFNVGQLPGFYLMNYFVPPGSFGDFYAEINYDVINLLGVVVPIGKQVFDATPGPAVLAGAGAVAMASPGGGLNIGTVAFSPNPLLNGRLRISGFIIWIADNEAGPVSLEIEEGGIDEDGAINDDVESAILLSMDESLSFDNSDATTDGPDGDSAECTPGKDIWYVVQSPGDGKFDVSLCADTSFDSTMSFYYLGNSSTAPEIDSDSVFAGGPFGCIDACEGSVIGVTTNDWILVRLGGKDDGVNEPASGPGSIRATFRQLAYSTGVNDAVYFESPASGACDTLIQLGWSSGAVSAGQPQRWTAQAFTVPAGPEWGGYAITELDAYGFTPSGAVNETMHYVVWHRNGTQAPTPVDQVVSGAVAFPTMYANYDHVIDLSAAPIELPPGDYWLTLYAGNSTNFASPANFAWFTNAPNGINVLDGQGNPFMWRSSQYPSPGMLAYVVPPTACFVQQSFLDSDDLYNTAFELWGTPLVGSPPTPPCPADVTGDGTVDGADLAALLGSWGSNGAADLNDDGVVNGADLAAMLGSWGGCS